ncbi:hypothetical protein M9H77_08877 [Catharanthus roseus]|uniref:Uncharacterized protein n=1 Tax=Catharanthus roseus TaxID=4058 RepID=A0ACC0BZ79_CATRO|nr:hypothetical protein M9H77_08877 [Catharanthus roseus]
MPLHHCTGDFPSSMVKFSSLRPASPSASSFPLFSPFPLVILSTRLPLELHTPARHLTPSSPLSSPLAIVQAPLNSSRPMVILVSSRNLCESWNFGLLFSLHLKENLSSDSWQDGLLGTNCPIPSKWNWTYQFQVKDQIGSFFYFPSLNFQRASGGFVSFITNNRVVIPILFGTPYGDITIVIGDLYT